MVAVITTGQNPGQAVCYNERKVERGVAFALLAMNYPGDIDELTLRQKILRLENLGCLNPRVSMRSLHITLSFDMLERLEQSTMAVLATDYMRRIGFGNQPYLVYEHRDTPHPHLHIVTTPVDRDGVRIPINDLVRVESRQITEAMEVFYNLRKTYPVYGGIIYAYDPIDHGRNLLEEAFVPFISLDEALSPAMSRVLDKVLTDYRFTNLEEFNALLSPFRLRATRGGPTSMTYEHHGLIYQALDEEGRPKRCYIKASHLPGKPTLFYLEERFEQHRPEQAAYAVRIRNLVDWSLVEEGPHTLPVLYRNLESAGVQTIWAHPKNVMVPSVVYIDHQTHWAFGGVALGEPYSAPGLMRRCHLDLKDLEQSLTQLEEQDRHTPGDTEQYWYRGFSQ